jgi:AcrR family transcriptional regulator
MRDAERTRGEILDAARRILARDGFAALGVNALAAEAGVGKPLIYRYFGNMEGIAAALVSGMTAGVPAPASAVSPVTSSADPEDALNALIGYGRGLAADRTRRDLLAWSLAARAGPALDGAGQEAPAAPAGFASGSGSGSAPGSAADVDHVAIMAILQAASTFLLVWGDRHAAWAGLPLNEPRHRARLERALAAILDSTLSGSDVTKK